MPSSSRVVTSQQSSKNYEVLNSDDNISAGFQPTRLLQLIIFLPHGFQSRSSEKSLASQVFCDSLSECNIQVILAKCVSL